jgi:hypothetical protein
MKFSPSTTPLFSAPIVLGLSSLLLSSGATTSSVGAQSLSCSPDQSTLVVTVQTDYYPEQNEWVLEKQEDDDPMEGNWTVVAFREFEGLERYTVYEDTECLDPDSTYRWTITDEIVGYSGGTGIFSSEGYTVSVNGEVVSSLDPPYWPDSYWSEKEVIFVSPSDPSGPVECIGGVCPSVSPSESPSVSLNPTESFVPTFTPCEGDKSEFTVTLLTDNYYFENEWVLEKLEEESGGWTEVASNPLPDRNTVFEDRACLEPDSTYRWVLTDTWGDGWLCYIECAYYELGLNGEIFSSYYESPSYDPPFDEKRVLFVTPSDSSGSAEVVTSGPTATPSSTPSVSAAPSETPTGSAAPSDGPTVFVCDDDDKPLNIDVKTDDRPYENSWELEEWDQSSETWFRIASNGLPYGFDDEFTNYIDNVCLETGRSYRWTLTDDPNPNYIGNGLNCVAGRGCGKYYLRLDGEIIVTDGKFFSEVVKEIGPVVDCIDEKGLHRVENPAGGRFIEARCKGLRKLIRGTDGAKALEACGATLIDGSGNLWDKCKRSCAAFGAGPCAGR